MGWGGQFYFAISGERELSLRLSGGLQILIVKKKKDKRGQVRQLYFSILVTLGVHSNVWINELNVTLYTLFIEISHGWRR